MTTNQIIALARLKLLEQTTEVIADTTLLLYANLTQQDIYKRVFPNNQILSTTIALTNGVGNLPTNFGTLYGPGFDSANNRYEELSIADFDAETLSNAVTIEGGDIKVLPTTLSSITIKYYPTFADLSAVVNPTIESYFHEPIVYGILGRAFEDLQDEQLATFYTGKYESMIKDRISIQSSYEEENQRGGQMFNYIPLI